MEYAITLIIKFPAGKTTEALDLIRLREQLLFEQNTITHAESLGETILNAAIRNLDFFSQFAGIDQTSLMDILDSLPTGFNRNILADVLEKKKKRKGDAGAAGGIGRRESYEASVQKNLALLFRHIASVKQIDFQVRSSCLLTVGIPHVLTHTLNNLKDQGHLRHRLPQRSRRKDRFLST